MDQRLAQYTGLPYRHNGRSWDGVDAWGLIYLVYREVFGIDLPICDSSTPHAEPVDPNWKQVDWAWPGDVLIILTPDGLVHALYAGNSKFLTARPGVGTVAESLETPEWRPFYRLAMHYDTTD